MENGWMDDAITKLRSIRDLSATQKQVTDLSAQPAAMTASSQSIGRFRGTTR